jgi:hypothetical protein
MMQKTTLAFRTPNGGVFVPAGARQPLGVVDVASFAEIRVFAAALRSFSTVEVVLSLYPVELLEGVLEDVVGDWQYPLDSITLKPGQTVTVVCAVPGIALQLQAMAATGLGGAQIDVAIYGR